ncbi:hypothetical protein RRG08_066417 [Elysia crispata]|uniref:Uncharacterized protein n=1 Tax=Elysia crispata TaxID=231223 RepID=A0AAE1B7L9_9GAST|nr:hypothetical protein RRG08_066417 [Elysia crispata]
MVRKSEVMWREADGQEEWSDVEGDRWKSEVMWRETDGQEECSDVEFRKRIRGRQMVRKSEVMWRETDGQEK